MNEEENSLSDLILQTIKYALQRQSVTCDKTFVTTIQAVNSDGTYTIKDSSGATRNVKCSLPNTTLSVGQTVYACIPSGKLRWLHICGIV